MLVPCVVSRFFSGMDDNDWVCAVEDAVLGARAQEKLLHRPLVVLCHDYSTGIDRLCTLADHLNNRRGT